MKTNLTAFMLSRTAGGRALPSMLSSMFIENIKSKQCGHNFSAGVLLVLNIFVFNTFTIYRTNVEEFDFGFFILLEFYTPWISILALGIFLLACLLPKAISRRFASLVLMLGILTWVQASFLFWDYGVFDGRDTNWGQFDKVGWLDLGLWVILLVISLRFAKQLLPISSLVAWILITGQTVLILTQEGLRQDDWQKHPQFSNAIPEGILEVSTQKNVFHIILDSMQTDAFIEVIEDSNLSAGFEGFTLFYENIGVTPHTSLAIPAIFSGEAFDASQPASSYYRKAMTAGFQSQLYQAGYTINLVPQLSMEDSNYSSYYRIPSTYHGTIKDAKRQDSAQLLDISLFRSVPHFLRKAIYDEGNWFFLSTVRWNGAIGSLREKAFLKDYIQGLSLEGSAPAYHFFHLTPPHPPYVTLANGVYSGKVLPNTRENYLNESRAIVELIAHVFEKLKSLGVYDDSMIILQGDHGSQIYPEINGALIKTCVARMPALLAVKPPRGKGQLKTSHAPTSILDIAPTILKLLDGDHQSVFDLHASQTRQRPFLFYDSNSAVPKIVTYSINGSVFDPGSCTPSGSKVVRTGGGHYELGRELQFGMTGNADAFMGVGWSPCQASYCSTIGTKATVSLPVDEIVSDLLLRVRFRPNLDEASVTQQRIVVSVNDVPLADWVVSRSEYQEPGIIIPSQILKGESIEIAFQFPDAVSPVPPGDGHNTRGFSMAVQSLRIDAVDED